MIGRTSRLARLLLSSGLVAVSAAYALWERAAPASATAPSAHAPAPGAAPRVAPGQEAEAAIIIDARPTGQATPERAPDVALATPVPAPDERSLTAPTQAQDIPSPAPMNAAPAPEAAPPAAPMSPAPTVVAAAPAESAPRSRFADGEFIGDSTDTSWGAVQVKVVVKGGSVVEVDPLDYPNHRRRSVQINDWAIPRLEQEALSVQGANVDLVSQATVTSYGYRESLASALALARK